MNLNVVRLKKGARPAGKYLADWVQGRVWQRRPKLSGQSEAYSIDRSLNGANGPALFPHGLLQALDRLRGKVPLTRLDVDPGRHVFDEQEPPVDLDVVGHGLFDQWLGSDAVWSGIILLLSTQATFSHLSITAPLIRAGRMS